jgi:hypothetical protein
MIEQAAHVGVVIPIRAFASGKEAYWADLGARIRSAAGDGPFVLDFRVQLLLAAG